ncbi:syntaxin binding protein 6 (amisyn), like [Engraulis encrasicolus]|uniref:syntaxin binding protein 6 (amisyn), like n=1 Tax=Engraulis encrasicolus TaxID=184585 RepID=UPI002FD4667D
MSIQSNINREIFAPCDHKLLVAIEAKRRNKRRLTFLSSGREAKYKTFICLSATNKAPVQLFITKVKQFEGSPQLIKRSQWNVDQLRQVNGINPNKDCPEFDLLFDRSFDQWMAATDAEKCMFIQVLYHACQNHWKVQDAQQTQAQTQTQTQAQTQAKAKPGEASKDPLPQKPAAPAPAPAPTRKKGPTVPRTKFINCQSKLMEDACTMNMVIYRCKIFLNRVKSSMLPPPKRRPAPGQAKPAAKPAAKPVAKPAAKSAGVKSRSLSPARPSRGGGSGSMKKAVRRASVALGERGDKLLRADDRTAHMMDSARLFSGAAHKLALKYS